jgi:hypothetical protein
MAKADRQSTKIAVTGAFFAVGAWRVSCQRLRPRARSFFRNPFYLSLNFDFPDGWTRRGKFRGSANGNVTDGSPAGRSDAESRNSSDN